MHEVSRVMPVPPSRVFAVLSDGWTYPLWVVGASRMRDVDAGWPAVGTRIHHSVGLWPLLIDDTTEVLDVAPDRHLELTARAWPTGTARIRIELAEVPGGTRVTMGESAEAGPATLLPGFVQGVMLRPRNREALERLENIAVHRQPGSPRDLR